MIVHIYNPSHDEALAINREQYCPSSAARRTGEKFWDIARQWAAPEDVILHLPDDGSLRGAVFCGVEGHEKGAADFDWNVVTTIEPWGWDRHIVGVLRKLGAPERLLPSLERLDRIRDLSSRRTTVRVLEHLRCKPLCAGVLSAESRWCTAEEEVHDATVAFGGVAMLKQPWSCSGRGVWRTTMDELSAEGSPASSRVRKTLREQGAVEAEPVYDRLADFAMEFYADHDGGVRYEGLSLFDTHDSGAYKGNAIAPQDELQRRLEALAPASLLNDEGHLPLIYIKERLCKALSLLLADYTGPLGVDMMLTPAGIHPCIEVNLRNTMGRVAIFQAQQTMR